MNENKIAFPDWVTDPELFAQYMEDISNEPFWKKPFPASWNALRPVEIQPAKEVAPAPEKPFSLFSIVGFMWHGFRDDMRWWF